VSFAAVLKQTDKHGKNKKYAEKRNKKPVGV
jgi:hypothetical protein